MSSILKALQKVEAEKAAARNAGRLATEISRTRQKRGWKPRWLFPVAMTVVAVVAVLATYTLMGGFSQGRQQTVPQPGIEAAAPLPQSRPVESSLPPSAAPPVADSVTVQPMITRPVAVKVPSAPPRRNELPESPDAAGNDDASSPETSAEPPAVRAAELQTERTAGLSPASHAASDLTVSGIAWQKESTSRLAVVNGVPIAQGAILAGARVEEILPDRVRFTRDSHSFEVFLGKTSADK
jgi:general secretion pathway protein B